MREFSVQSLLTHLRPIMATVETEALRETRGLRAKAPGRLPFMTISREAGVSDPTVAEHLVARLNASVVDEHPWTLWDKDLVEKVAAEHHLSAPLIESLDKRPQTWLEELLGGCRAKYEPSEVAVYHRVAETIRALAQVGHVIIVGRGGVFVTGDMPHGIHLRIVAPSEYRVARLARTLHLPAAAAAKRMLELDHNREVFYGRYWPGRTLGAEAFSVTLNAAKLSDEQMVESIVTLVEHMPAVRAAQVAQGTSG